MKIIIQLLIIFISTFFYTQICAQDFTYKPVNPSFGGDTFNYNWLLSSAESQNKTKDTDAITSSSRDTGNSLDDFSESLNRQLLSNLSRSLVSSQFGEGGLEEGTYSLGGFDINVEDVGDGLSVTIFDGSTGSETQIIVPYF